MPPKPLTQWTVPVQGNSTTVETPMLTQSGFYILTQSGYILDMGITTYSPVTGANFINSDTKNPASWTQV